MKIQLLIYILFQSFYIHACSCNFPTEISEAYNITNAVIHGEVVNVNYVTLRETFSVEGLNKLKELELEESQEELLDADYIIEAKIVVHEAFKGNFCGDTLTMYTTRQGASCGYTDLKKGTEYLFYASQSSFFYGFVFPSQNSIRYEKEDTYWLTLCSLTSRYEEKHAQVLREISGDEQLDELVSISLNALANKNLLNQEKEVYVASVINKELAKFKEFELNGQKILNRYHVDQTQVVLHVGLNTGSQRTIRFVSFNAGTEHSGSIDIVNVNSEWIFSKLSYVSAIE